MTYTNVVIGKGRNAEEALLFARVNQICCDKGIDNSKISTKVDYFEIPKNIKGLNGASEKINSVYFAHGYHRYMRDIANNGSTKLEFTESEYKYYSILIKNIGKNDFNRLMGIYENKEPHVCIAVKMDSEYYKFMY